MTDGNNTNSDAGITKELAETARVNNAYRTSLLNVKYYGYKLKWATRFNLFAEITIAVTSAGGVSGWAIWSTKGGASIWATVVGLAALLAVLKPILPLSRNISTYSKLHAGHTSNFLALKDVAESMAIEKRFTREMSREFDHTRKRHREMAAHDEPAPSTKLLERFQAEVNSQIPVDSLWWGNR